MPFWNDNIIKVMHIVYVPSCVFYTIMSDYNYVQHKPFGIY